ncbi:hypothetical protein D3C86_1820230 [compost metagenome]
MACVALNIPRAIRLILLFNILFFSLIRLIRAVSNGRNGAIALLFQGENKKARPRFLAAGLLLFLSRGGRPQALGRIVAAPLTRCQFHESSRNRRKTSKKLLYAAEIFNPRSLREHRLLRYWMSAAPAATDSAIAQMPGVCPAMARYRSG